MTAKICKPPFSPDAVLPALEEFSGSGLEPEGDYDALEFSGVDLAGEDGRGARFLECALREVSLDEALLKNARFLSGVWERVRGVGVQLAGAQLRDVELLEARLGGVQLHGAVLERVRVVGGKFDYLNLRQAKLRDVSFEGCVLVEPDLAGAELQRVSFHDCELRQANLAQATLRDVDFRGAARLEISDGFDRLAGAVVTPGQLLDLAPALAARLGLVVAPR
ncbi:pentapeptide repeat-containing protein [Streptomyces sp. XM4193]|uniref:pentapeptide repeat-containing protein n=1 Tax=Streptomyces sp. XM4193 TaxID=2929782 RepID=UPI001FFA8692|nr:pentapeptide repeat-containing protein [Streptomyces sp. XM4193]MCK1795296.1 pentapeptide repeat-containing protein [Streptomyces sp. XM4193]